MSPTRLFSFLAVATATPLFAADSPNLYWPGTFEGAVFGGNFSSAKNVQLETGTNHTPGGTRAWKIQPGYQHLELLTDGTGDFEVSFHARAESRLEVVLKVISPGADGKLAEDPHSITIEPSEDWREYRAVVPVSDPYPGPRTGEILVTAFQSGDADIWIDDLEVRRASEDPDAPSPAPAPDATTSIPLGGESELAVDQAPIPSSISRDIPVDGLAGNHVRVWLDVTYDSVAEPAKNWAGVVAELRATDAAGSSTVLESTPAPFWLPIGHAAPAGEPRTIRAEYSIPADAQSLTFLAQLQPGAQSNGARLENHRIERLSEK